MRNPICIGCKRVNQDDIRIHKSPHIQRESLRTQRPPPDTSRPFNDKGEAARFLVYAVTQLTPVELVAALHLARGGTSRTLAKALTAFADDWRNYKCHANYGKIRGLMGMKKRRLMSRYPGLQFLRVWKDGAGE